MKLFTLNKNSLQEINQQPFKLEKDIQKVVEENCETIFGLKFIKSEFTVDKYRIDSLCFNEENNSFVIVEYKKGSSYSVIDQGYTYLQLLLNNKSDFILVLSQYLNKVLTHEDIDWSQSRIVFISPSFNKFQKDSVNFKDLPFELWEIKRFSNSTIILNEHKSNSQESIDTLSSKDSQTTISSVSNEVKVYNIEDHLSKINSELREKWDELSERLSELEDAEIVPKKPYISLLYHGTTVCYFNFRKNSIWVDILRGNINPVGTKSKNYFDIDDPKNISTEGSWEWKSGTKGTLYKIAFTKDTDIDYLVFLIKQKYKALVDK